MAKLLCVPSTALALAVCASISTAPVVDARMVVPWNLAHGIVDQIPRHMRTQANKNDAMSLDAKLQVYVREGRFPKAGRSLEAKVREAHAFLERQTSTGAAGVGVAAAIVDKDEVRRYQRRYSIDPHCNDVTLAR